MSVILYSAIAHALIKHFLPSMRIPMQTLSYYKRTILKNAFRALG